MVPGLRRTESSEASEKAGHRAARDLGGVVQMSSSTSQPAYLFGPGAFVPCPDILTPERHPARRVELVVAEALELRSTWKRAMDLVGAAAGLVLLSPVLLLIAILIRIDSPGPVLFRQRRMGQGGREFRFLKFRTMVPDAERRLAELEDQNESAGGVLFKIRNDPRVTRIGAFLRRTSLDELPQLFNILRGDMSLVGPRPLQMRDCERLRAVDPEGYALRLSVPQGLTGAWQVGGRSDEDALGMLRLDLDYVQDWSLGRDLSIILRTVPAVLTGRGAC
jgi:lipopolysaccharide/colanic/teichoic acid biosynthesis glycosyltransferase